MITAMNTITINMIVMNIIYIYIYIYMYDCMYNNNDSTTFICTCIIILSDVFVFYDTLGPYINLL